LLFKINLNRKIYVFGGGGFLGKAFCRVWPGAVPCDSAERLERAGANGVKFDFGVDRPEALPCGVGDLAVIFSWRGYPAAHDADPVGKLALNLSSTLELVSWLAARRVSGIFYASTGGAVYGNAGLQPVSETMATNPVGFYGIGKATAEMYVRKVCRESGVRHMVFRIGNAYGIDQIRDNLSVGFIAKAVQCALTGNVLEIWGDGSTRRDYIHSEDVAAGFASAIRNPEVPSGIYNLGSGVAISNIEVVKIVERVLSRKVNVVFRSARPFDVEGICLDCSALRQASGWKEKYSMEDGIREMTEVLVDRS
jgi:UDP-glucose 4-epimerase